MNRPITSASNIHRRKLCPGSERLEAGLPDEESDQSREGSFLHSYDANPALDRGILKPYHRDLLRISGELDDFVFERVSEQFGINEKEPFDTGREQELWARNVEGEQIISGHCDLWRYWPRVKLLVIVDKKFGYKIVTTAVANLQLRVYAIAGAQKWECENVLVAVTQPRLPFAERLTLAAYSKADIEKSREELLWILREATQLDAPLAAGEEQCRYCKAKLLCPAYKAKFMSVAVTPERSLAECDDEQLEKILVAIQFADFIKDQARDEGRRRVALGQLTNYKLGKESEMRSVADVRRAISLLALRGDLSTEDMMESLSMSIGSLEEKVRERRNCKWKEAKEIVAETLAPVIERTVKKQSLVRIK